VTVTSTTDMKILTTYYDSSTGTGWDFTDTWAIDTSDLSPINGGYPYLQDNKPAE
jgi:hypothetical protein